MTMLVRQGVGKVMGATAVRLAPSGLIETLPYSDVSGSAA